MLCEDLWYLEVEVPQTPGRVQLVRASTHSLEERWGASPSCDSYLLQAQKYDLTTLPRVSIPSTSGSPLPSTSPASPSSSTVGTKSPASPAEIYSSNEESSESQSSFSSQFMSSSSPSLPSGVLSPVNSTPSRSGSPILPIAAPQIPRTLSSSPTNLSSPSQSPRSVVSFIPSTPPRTGTPTTSNLPVISPSTASFRGKLYFFYLC